MRNWFITLISGLLVLLSACSDTTVKQEKMISVTIEPQRYLAEKIAGDLFQVHCVVPAGQSPETYDPSPQEMIQLSKSRAYLRIGDIGFEQAWIKAIQEQNPHLQFFETFKDIPLLASAHQHEHGEACEHHHGANDPHIWTSVVNMKIIARNTLNAFISLDPENQEIYQQNYKQLIAEIEATETTLKQLLTPMQGKAFIIYHPALTYFAHDYGLKQLCIEMNGKEPSPKQIQEIIQTAKENQAKTVFIQQEFDQKNAEIIARETGCQSVVINPLAYEWNQEMIKIAKALAQ